MRGDTGRYLLFSFDSCTNSKSFMTILHSFSFFLSLILNYDYLFMRLRPEELASREAMIFKDPIFMKSSTWVLSTSMLVSEHFVGSGYGQVTDAGYGSAYVFLDITSETHFFRPYDD
jgi:hypothetical protein